MGDKSGGSKDRNKAEKQVAASQKDASMAPSFVSGTPQQIEERIMRPVEKDARDSEKTLEKLTQQAAVPGQKYSYYTDKVFKMEDAINANPNLTNYQKVTEIDKIRSQVGLGSGNFKPNTRYSLNERLENVGIGALEQATKATPLTQEDFKGLSFDQRQRAAELMSRYKNPVVMTRDGEIQSTGGFRDMFTDVAGTFGQLGKSVISGDIGLPGIIKSLSTKDQEVVEPNYFDSDYADYFPTPRYLDEEFNFSPTGDYLGITATPEGKQMQNMFLSQNDQGTIVPTAPATAPIEEIVEEELPSILGGYDASVQSPITYPYGTGNTLVSYEDLINRIG
jgi:hypothetical protein